MNPNLFPLLKIIAMIIISIVTTIYITYLIKKDKKLEKIVSDNEKFRIKANKQIKLLALDISRQDMLMENILHNPVNAFGQFESSIEDLSSNIDEKIKIAILNLQTSFDNILTEQTDSVNNVVEAFETKQLQMARLIEKLIGVHTNLPNDNGNT